MRCLRCGKPMSSTDNSCPHCHHYYVNKVGKKGGDKGNNKIFDKSKIYFLLAFTLIIIVVVVIPIVAIIIYNTNLNTNDEYTSNEKEKCLIICENNLKEIKNNYCICSDGTRRNLNENSTSE